jgi:hypothetical protein
MFWKGILSLTGDSEWKLDTSSMTSITTDKFSVHGLGLTFARRRGSSSRSRCRRNPQSSIDMGSRDTIKQFWKGHAAGLAQKDEWCYYALEQAKDDLDSGMRVSRIPSKPDRSGTYTVVIGRSDRSEGKRTFTLSRVKRVGKRINNSGHGTSE